MKDGIKYVGIDAHTASCRFYVRKDGGTRDFECTVPTTETAILDLIGSLTGRVFVAFEEGNLSAWLYELLVPHVAEVIVCNPRENRSGIRQNKCDRIDAEKLSLWLYKGVLKRVYHEDHGTQRLRNLVHIYEQLVTDRSSRPLLDSRFPRRIGAYLPERLSSRSGYGTLRPPRFFSPYASRPILSMHGGVPCRFPRPRGRFPPTEA